MINITFIYLIEGIDNSPNKVYIGKTKDLISRAKAHKTKYGHHITYSVIDEINSLERKDWGPLESYWIQQFTAWGFEVVNKNKGGGGCIAHTKEGRHKISINNIGKIRPNSGGKNKPKPEGFGKILSNILKGKPNIKNQIPRPHLRLSVCQYSLNGNFIKEYSSLSEACTYMNKPLTRAGYISWACKGIKKQAYGYVWKYTNYLHTN